MTNITATAIESSKAGALAARQDTGPLKRAIRRYVSIFSFLNKSDFPSRPRQIEWRGHWLAAEDQRGLVEDILTLETGRAQTKGLAVEMVASEIAGLCEPQPARNGAPASRAVSSKA